MTDTSEQRRVAVVTGANAGIGRELVRQLAGRSDFERIYLAARSPERLAAAIADLSAETGHRGLIPLEVDVTDTAAVRRAAAEVSDPIDVLVMNAGGIGPDPMGHVDSGATRISALNTLGHVALVDELTRTGQLTDLALYAGTEGSRGVPIFGLPRPKFADTVEGVTAVIDGSYYQDHKFNPTIAYGDTKYVGVLAMAALARQHKAVRIVSVSPGATTGTNAGNDLSAVQRFVLGRIAPALRLAHGIEVGAGRYVTAIDEPGFLSGHFYASPAGRLSGRLIDQEEVFPESASLLFQDNALGAVRRFVPQPAAPSGETATAEHTAN